MSRENLFRGRRPDNGEWVYGDLYHRKICGVVSPTIHNMEYTGGSVDPATVGQYIGVKDKDSKRIFEGDIVDCWSQGRHCTNGIVTWMENRIFIAVKGKDGHVVDNWHIMPNNSGIDESLSVIGNIHDNPELLEGGEKQAQEDKIRQTYRPLVYPNFSKMDKNDSLFQFLDRRRPYDPSDFVPKYDIPYINHDEN